MALRKNFRKQRKEIKLNLPSAKELPQLLQKTGAAKDVRIMQHLKTVHKGANAIAEAAHAAGLPVNIELVSSAAMLHDFAMPGKDLERKTMSKATQIQRKISKKSGIEPRIEFKHERVASELLRRKGYPELAQVIGRHGDRPIGAIENKFNLEERILDLVDSRAMGTGFVSLDEKLDYLLERYTKPENLPPIYKKPEEYAKYIRKKYAAHKRFQTYLKEKGADVDKLLKDLNRNLNK